MSEKTQECLHQGQCSTCTVIINDKVVRSCLTKMQRVSAEASIAAIEGIGQPGQPPLQRSWGKPGATQCGFCTPELIVSAADVPVNVN